MTKQITLSRVEYSGIKKVVLNATEYAKYSERKPHDRPGLTGYYKKKGGKANGYSVFLTASEYKKFAA